MRARGSVVLLAALPLAGCASAPPERPVSPLALRQAQSRSYTESDARSVLKSVLATLQDEGFTVRTADSSLGFVTATRETLRSADAGLKALRWTAAVFTYGLALLAPSPKGQITQIEATAHVEDLGEGEIRLRVSFQLCVIETNGHVRRIEDVTDPAPYQAFLAKVDKSLYYQREKL